MKRQRREAAREAGRRDADRAAGATLLADFRVRRGEGGREAASDRGQASRNVDQCARRALCCSPARNPRFPSVRSATIPPCRVALCIDRCGGSVQLLCASWRIPCSSRIDSARAPPVTFLRRLHLQIPAHAAASSRRGSVETPQQERSDRGAHGRSE